MKAIPFFLIDIHLTFMPRFRLSLSMIFSFLILSLAARAQEDARQLEGWTVSSSRIGDKEFRIRFELADSKGWQVYAPVQATPDIALAELHWTDSSLGEASLQNEAGAKEVQSEVFGMPMLVYDGPAAFSTSIRFDDVVPANIQGTLLYNFGKAQEFYNATFSFTASLEGGTVAKTRIRIPTININHPFVGGQETALVHI